MGKEAGKEPEITEAAVAGSELKDIGTEPEGEPTVDDLTILAVKSDECDQVTPTLDEWVAHGKTIPAVMVFARGSPWFDEATSNKSAKVLSESVVQSQTE